MQRLGLLKLLVSISSQQSTGTLIGAGQELVRILTAKLDLRWEHTVATYVRAALSEQTFATIRLRASQFLSGETMSSDQASIEIQDAYLSQRCLPSRRGRLSHTDDYSRFPHWGVSLGLTRKEPFSPLVRGNMLLELVAPSEISAFKCFDEACNPLELTRPQRAFFLYVLLEKDLSVLAPLYERLLVHAEPFSDLQAGDLLPDIYVSAARLLRDTGRGGHDADRATQLRETADAIRARQGKSYGKTVREQTITPRLEPFVDIGILAKPNAYSYEYQFTRGGREFFSTMTGRWQRVPYFSGFGRAVSTFLEYRDRRVSSEPELVHLIHGAWSKLKSDLGYSSIQETLLLALVHGLESDVGWFELDEALDTLQRVQKDEPGLVRFNIDRQGNLSVIRFPARSLGSI